MRSLTMLCLLAFLGACTNTSPLPPTKPALSKQDLTSCTYLSMGGNPLWSSASNSQILSSAMIATTAIGLGCSPTQVYCTPSSSNSGQWVCSGPDQFAGGGNATVQCWNEFSASANLMSISCNSWSTGQEIGAGAYIYGRTYTSASIIATADRKPNVTNVFYFVNFQDVDWCAYSN